jgi:glycosyltransferase involved in cell wall biosynthesis
MTRNDYEKYHCGEANLVAAVGEMLLGFDSRTVLIHDGLEPEEFLPPKPPPPRFPERILVIGSSVEWKGWDDAIRLAGFFPDTKFLFTGKIPGKNQPNVEFLGRVEAFRDLVRGFDLALNPSWHESFGMAALEVLAAGVPLLSTRSGVIEQVITDERYLTRPRDVEEMKRKLGALAAAWQPPQVASLVAACQARIRERFPVERAAQRLREAYAALLGR